MYNSFSSVVEKLNQTFSFLLGCISFLAVIHFSKIINRIIETGFHNSHGSDFVMHILCSICIGAISGNSFLRV